MSDTDLGALTDLLLGTRVTLVELAPGTSIPALGDVPLRDDSLVVATAAHGYNFDLAISRVWVFTGSSPTTEFTFTNVPVGFLVYCRFFLLQSGAGGNDWIFPANVWLDPVPVYNKTGGFLAVVDLFTIDGGTVWYGGVSWEGESHR